MKHSTSGDLKSRSGTSWLIYGPTGVGKTPLASAFPHPWFWDFDAGAHSMLRNDIPVHTPENYSEVLGLLQAVQMTPRAGRIKLSTGEITCCTIVIDVIAELARVIEKSHRKAEQSTLPEWYLTVERMRNVTRALRDLRDKGFNIVFVAHEQFISQAGLEVIRGLPDLPGKELPIDLPKLCDVVGHLEVKQTQNGLVRQLTCTPSGIFIGRDRRGLIDVLPVNLNNVKELEQLLISKGATHSCEGR